MFGEDAAIFVDLDATFAAHQHESAVGTELPSQATLLLRDSILLVALWLVSGRDLSRSRLRDATTRTSEHAHYRTSSD